MSDYPGSHPRDGVCGICTQNTSSLAGNPSLWPIWLPFNNGNGKVRPYHMGCVIRCVALYREVAELTREHDSIHIEPDTDFAVVYPNKLGAALEKVDKDWCTNA